MSQVYSDIDGVSSQIHAPAALQPVHNEEVDGWVPEPVGTLQTGEKKNLLPPPSNI